MTRYVTREEFANAWQGVRFLAKELDKLVVSYRQLAEQVSQLATRGPMSVDSRPNDAVPAEPIVGRPMEDVCVPPSSHA